MNIDYGEHGLTFEIPDDANVTILEPTYQSALSNISQSLREALKNPIGAPPLGTTVKASDYVAIVFSEFTRPVPIESSSRQSWNLSRTFPIRILSFLTPPGRTEAIPVKSY